jgi:hypothetical protein
VPIHLDRQTWFYLDVGAAAVFVAHLVFVRWSLTAPPRSGPLRSASSLVRNRSRECSL